jgi:RNA polymerase primary sigma factor
MDEHVLKWFFDKINKIPQLTRKEEHDLAIYIKDKNILARNLLVEANLRIVPSIAIDYDNHNRNYHCNHELSIWDLIQNGCLGLIDAAVSFDPNKGARFSTYAMYLIHEAIMDDLTTKVCLIKLSLYKMRNRKNQKNSEENLHNEPAGFKSAEEEDLKENVSENILSEDILNEKEIEYLETMSQGLISLNESYEETNEFDLIDTLEDKNASSPDQKLFDEFLTDKLNEALDGLPEVERSVLKMRFGLDGHKRMTLNQVGDKLHLSEGRIRQIEKKALHRLKNLFKGGQLDDFWD